jgi:hypothetical protein
LEADFSAGLPLYLKRRVAASKPAPGKNPGAEGLGDGWFCGKVIDVCAVICFFAVGFAEDLLRPYPLSRPMFPLFKV